VAGGRAAAPEGLVRRGEVARGIEEVMDDDRSAEYRSLKTLSRSLQNRQCRFMFGYPSIVAQGSLRTSIVNQ